MQLSFYVHCGTQQSTISKLNATMPYPYFHMFPQDLERSMLESWRIYLPPMKNNIVDFHKYEGWCVAPIVLNSDAKVLQPLRHIVSSHSSVGIPSILSRVENIFEKVKPYHLVERSDRWERIYTRTKLHVYKNLLQMTPLLRITCNSFVPMFSCHNVYVSMQYFNLSPEFVKCKWSTFPLRVQVVFDKH